MRTVAPVVDSVAELKKAFPYGKAYVSGVITNDNKVSVAICNVRYNESFRLSMYFLKLGISSLKVYLSAIIRDPWFYISIWMDSKRGVQRVRRKIPIEKLEEILAEFKKSKGDNK